MNAQEPRDAKDLLGFLKEELKPKGRIFTPFNIISAPILVIGYALILYRFFAGLGPVVGNAAEHPWGIWIGFIVMVGVAFAGGAYATAFTVYVLKAERYHFLVRMAVLNGFLAYVFYAGAILLDLGRWWNIANPLIGNRLGVNSVLFLVAWHFLLYMIAEFIEIAPAISEWLGLKRLRRFFTSLTMGAVIGGITLSTLHQSGLGALFLMARWKIHPLWYTEFIPLLFFVSSVFAGLSVVIFLGTVCCRVFKEGQLDDEFKNRWKDVIFDLGKACAVAMFVYFFLQLLVLIHNGTWRLLSTPMGWWYLTEVVGLVLAPCLLFAWGVRRRGYAVINAAAVLTMAGVIINRVNYSLIAYKWYLPLGERYVPSWMEVVITLSIVFTMIWVFRWIVNRAPILRRSPAWAAAQDEEGQRARLYLPVPELGVTMADGGKALEER